ncbi:MAG: leucine-rich repeat domain-containing protein, partial [Oscillospiraceae bacterium]
IGGWAFYVCSGLTSIIIPDSVTSIGSGAFEGCTGLTSVTITDSVTRIERYVFRSCTSLTSVTIGNSVTNIGSWAFDDCTGLKGITIPDSVTSIGKRAFGYYFDGNNAVKVDGFTITGTKGSAAEKYATDWGFNFIDIETIPNAKNNIIIKRVEQYASTSNDEELQNIMKTTDFNDTQQFNKFADYVNKAELSFKERMDYNFLINNEIYVAWQFKEYAQTPSVRFTFGLGNLVFNDDISQIITGNFPEKEKYKDGLKKYIEISNENFESVEYVKDTYSFLSDLSEATGEVKKKKAIKDLGKKVKQCKTKTEVDKLLKQFDYDATLGNISFDYKNEVLAKSLGLAGDAIECTQITAEGIVNLMSVAQNYSTYQRYIEMFNTIKACTTLPSALRMAAYELSEDLYNQYINAIEETTKNVAGFVFGKVLDLTLLGTNVLLGSITAGLSIGKFIGNVFLGVGEMLNASAYLECYVRIAEMYAEKLKQDKIAFNSNKTEKNAQQFKDDYDALYKFRLIGERTYLEMVGYEKVWSNTTKNIMRHLGGYYEKKIFVDQNISSIMEKEFSIIDDERKATIPLRKTYSNMVTVACPVNVLVYNKENVLVGKIINDIVDSSVNDNAEFPLVTYVSENTKVIMLPNESDYRIEIEATDDGKMAYSSTKFSSDKSVEKKTNYYDVNLQKDSKFVVNSLSDGKIDYDSLYLTENNVSKEIKPDEVILKNNIEENSVYINVTLNENGFISGKTKYVKGDCAELNILPKKGFYISSVTLDGKNIELNDGLLVIDNITKNHKVNVVFGMLGDVTGDGRVTSGDAIAVLRAEAQL